MKEGDWSEELLSEWKGSKLHLVDPWVKQGGVYNVTLLGSCCMLNPSLQDVSNADQKTQDARVVKVIAW